MSDFASQFSTGPQTASDPLFPQKTDNQFTDFAQYFLVDHVQEFDSDIDKLVSRDPSLNEAYPFNPDPTDFFSDLRIDTPTRGVPSIITNSSASESAYDSRYSDSFLSDDYYYATSPPSQYPNLSLMHEIDQDMNRLGIRPSDRDSVHSTVMSSPGSERSSPGGTSIASSSPPMYHRASRSDYEPALHRWAPTSSTSDYSASCYPQSIVQTTVSPAHMSASLSPGAATPTGSHMTSSRADPSRAEVGSPTDPRKKYPCPTCHRSFARQFNLKTHIQTHDPNRAKPFACHHKGCGRAFSRKHDLMRHLTSIHRSGTPSSVGVGGSVARSRCDQCGKSWVSGKGKEAGCDCNDIK